MQQIIKAKRERRSLPWVRDAAAQLETKLYKMQGVMDEEDASKQLLEMQMGPNREYQRSLTGLMEDDELPRSLTGAYEDDPSHGIDEAHALQIQRRRHLRDFKYWFENAQDPASGLTREILCDMYRLELRRPLISDDELRNYLVSIGIDKDCDKTGRDREYRLRFTQQHETRKRPSGFHPSTMFAHDLPRGYENLALDTSNDESPFMMSCKDVPSSAPFQSFAQLVENDEPEAMRSESIEDIANAITLYRQKQYTIGQTLDVIKVHLAGLKFDVNEYLQEIDDPYSEEKSLAMCMLKNAFDDGPSDGDDDGDKSSEEDSSNDGQSEYLMNLKLEEEAAAKPKGKVKIRFTTGARFRSIYYDVMQGHLPVDKAPKLFREAIEQPDMPTVELIKVLLKYDVPPDMFFRDEDIAASAELDQSVVGKHVRFDEDTIHTELTPEQSRRSSAWINPESRPQTNYPDTPPDDSAFKTNDSGGYAGPEQFNETQMFPERLVHALQKSIDKTSGHMCRFNVIEAEEADVPVDFYEDVSDTSEEAEVPDKFYDTSEARPNPEIYPALETNSLGSSSVNIRDTVQRQYITSPPNLSITDLPSSSNAEKGQKTISAAQHSSTAPPESSPQLLEAGNIVSMQLVPTYSCDPDPYPPAPSQDLSMEHQDNDGHVREQTSEPLGDGSCSASLEIGVTSDLWGLTMPTQTAQPLASHMSLPKKCIQKIASHTPRRDAKKRDNTVADRKSLPRLKRKRSPTSSTCCGSKSARVEFETLMSASKGDGLRECVEKQIVPGPGIQESSSKDCCTNGRCHQCAWYVKNIQSSWHTISGTILPTINKVNRLDFSRKRLAAQMRESLENLIVKNDERLEFSNSRLAAQLKSSLDGLNLHNASSKLHGVATIDSSKAVKSDVSKKKSGKLVENLLQRQKASARTISSLRQHQLGTSLPKQSTLEHSPLQHSPISGLPDGTVKVDSRTPRKCTAKEESELNMLRWVYHGKIYLSKVPVSMLEEKDDVVSGIPDQPNGGWRKFSVISRAHKILYKNKLAGRRIASDLPASIWDFLQLCDEKISEQAHNPQSQILSNCRPGHAQPQPSMLCSPSSHDLSVPVSFELYDGEPDTTDVSMNADRTTSVSVTEVADDPDEEGLKLCRQSNCFASYEPVSSDREATPARASASPHSARTRCNTVDSGGHTPINARKCTVATIIKSATEYEIPSGISATLKPPESRPYYATLHVGAGDIAHVENVSVPSSSLPSSPCPRRASPLGTEDSRSPGSLPPCSSGSCSEGEHQTPQPCQPRPNCTQRSWPESCDIWEAAWDDKASIFVFLWRRRNKRSRTKKTAAFRYFQKPTPPTAKSNTIPNLNKLFDKYRGRLNVRSIVHGSRLTDDPESLETIGTSGTMQYLTDLGVQLDEPAVLAVLAELSAPTMGELTRDGFISGWKTYNADTLAKQQSSLSAFRSQLSKDPDYFRRVYRHAFILARMPGQKGVQLDTAFDFWRLLFGPGGIRWADARTDWLELWVAFLEAKWKKSVNKDMWEQTGVFALKCLEDGEMGWWSEDGAWPGVLDEFVGYVREKRKSEAGGGGEVDGMDVE